MNEHEQVADAMNSVDPNEEYQQEEVVSEEVVSEEPVLNGHHVDDSAALPQGGEGDVPAEAAEQEAPQYNPDFTYTVRGEKKEFDEWARQFINDKETEEKFRALMTKADGIDTIQEARDRYQQQYEELQPQFEKVNTDLGRLAHFRQNGNWQQFYKTLGLTPEEVFQSAQSLLQYQEMDPQQRMAYDHQMSQQSQNFDLAQQNEFLMQQMQQQVAEAKENEVNLIMTRPEISEFAQNFDQRIGREGAFRDEVWNRGRYHAMVNKTNISAEQAVNEVLQLVGVGQVGGSQTPQAPQAPTPYQAPAAPQAPAAKPSIPKIGASGASPVRKTVGSLADLRAVRKEKFGS